jgi:hypothetical protein
MLSGRGDDGKKRAGNITSSGARDQNVLAGETKKLGRGERRRRVHRR